MCQPTQESSHFLLELGPSKQRIQINRHRDELDLASVKAVSKILNSSVGETVEAIRQGRTVRPRDYSLKG
jgi:hypothetical protein